MWPTIKSVIPPRWRFCRRRYKIGRYRRLGRWRTRCPGSLQYDAWKRWSRWARQRCLEDSRNTHTRWSTSGGCGIRAANELHGVRRGTLIRGSFIGRRAGSQRADDLARRGERQPAEHDWRAELGQRHPSPIMQHCRFLERPVPPAQAGIRFNQTEHGLRPRPLPVVQTGWRPTEETPKSA